MPEALVSAVVSSWGEITEIRIKRRGGRSRWKKAAEPVACVTEEENEDEEIDASDQEPEDVAAEAWDRARSVAEAEGPDTFLFVGFHSTGSRTGEEVWTCPISIDADEEGELTASEDAGPEATHSAMAKSLRELSSELSKVHRLQSEHMRRAYSDLETLRTALNAHVADRLEISKESARNEAGIYEIQERTARSEALGLAFRDLMGPLGEQIGGELGPALAAWLRARTPASGTGSSDNAKPKDSPKDSKKSKDPITPSDVKILCEPAGVLDRVMSRVPAGTLAEFKAQFSEGAWSCWIGARNAASVHEFDQSMIDLLKHHKITDQAVAAAQFAEWGKVLPMMDLLQIGPVFQAVAERITWPLEL